MQTLEQKIAEEMEQIESESSTMRDELRTFADLEGLKEKFAERKLSLTKERQRLTGRMSSMDELVGALRQEKATSLELIRKDRVCVIVISDDGYIFVYLYLSLSLNLSIPHSLSVRISTAWNRLRRRFQHNSS